MGTEAKYKGSGEGGRLMIEKGSGGGFKPFTGISRANTSTTTMTDDDHNEQSRVEHAMQWTCDMIRR